MKSALRLARRAVTASPAELYTRAQQLWFATRNWGWSHLGRSAMQSGGHLRSLNVRRSDLADWWEARPRSWFVDVELDLDLQRAATDPATELPWVLERAELVMQDRMPLFSHAPIDFSGTDRWHTDFILDKVAPRKVSGLIDYLNVGEVGDTKHVWEPNRFAWAIWLGVAYRITQDTRFAQKFAELTADWFQQNPYPIGVNYCSALEVAFRNYAWLWSLDLFYEYLRTDTELLDQILRGIWVGCRHVSANLSTYFAPNTHIMGEGFGLFVCGAAIPEFREARRWRELGRDILERESHVQFHADGTHRELSSSYHIYATDFYVHALLVAQQTGFHLPLAITQAVRQLSQRLAELVPHDMILPQYNDCDGGRLMSLVPNALDSGPTLMAAEQCDAELALSPKGPRRGYALLMKHRTNSRLDTGASIHLHPPSDGEDQSCLYDSGLIAYRNRESDYVLFRASPFGFRDCPHSHDAPLGVIVHMNGAPVFVDSGVGSYTQDLAQRNEFRSAVGKNTVLIDGEGPSIPGGWFSWQRTTDCKLVSYRRFSDGFSARGKHNGFSLPPDRHVFVQREILLLDEGVLAIVDRWDADTRVAVQSQFTFSPRLRVDRSRQMLQEINGNITLHFSAVALETAEPLKPSFFPVPFSATYGQMGETEAMAFEVPNSTRGGIVTLLSRVGAVEHDEHHRFRCSGNPRVQLQLTDTSIRPVRAGSGRTTELLGWSGSK